MSEAPPRQPPCLPAPPATLTRTVSQGIAFRDVKGPNLKLFPTVGLKKTGEQVRVNFGQTPFVYDIDGVMKACVLAFLP